MKVLIWIGFIILFAAITAGINSQGFLLGGLPTGLMAIGVFYLASNSCKRYEERKNNKTKKGDE